MLVVLRPGYIILELRQNLGSFSQTTDAQAHNQRCCINEMDPDSFKGISILASLQVSNAQLHVGGHLSSERNTGLFWVSH